MMTCPLILKRSNLVARRPRRSFVIRLETSLKPSLGRKQRTNANETNDSSNGGPETKTLRLAITDESHLPPSSSGSKG